VSACALWAVTASAQTNPPAPSSEATRQSLTTSEGDTGLWYVPTAEVLARGKWSASGYRVALNYVQGFSNVADFPLTFGVGAFPHAEVFGSFKAITRVDRDVRPIFTSNVDVGGVIGRYPYVWRGWTGNQVGDFLVGVKINLLSEASQKPAAVAVRGSVKIPTGNRDSGVSTGKADSFLDLVVSKDLHGVAELSGFAGGAFRSSTADVTQSKGLRWGIGAGFPARGPLHLTTELNGEKPFDDVVSLSSPIVGVDGTKAPNSSTLGGFGAATVGLTWQQPNGFFLGAGATWDVPRKDRSNFQTDKDNFGDFVDFQFRIGYHPGVGRHVAPPPPPPPAPPTPPPPPPPPPNRPPTFVQGGPGGATGVVITRDGTPCDPCTVEPGQTITLSAPARDADGDTLTYRWTAPTGTFSTPNGATTQWTAPPGFEGTVPITVTADDGKGGTTSTTTTVRVARPAAPIVELNFEDVYFDFDRSTLRPEALRLLDDAVAKLQANPTRNMIIEGHTCNIGTAEYNLALGERRARGVQNYLTSRGIPASRLEIVSYGEERPKFDNEREETRRLNRRAALVIKVQ
jgi:outer membrane protein OmpA-like peptidoglycan-associated protein